MEYAPNGSELTDEKMFPQGKSPIHNKPSWSKDPLSLAHACKMPGTRLQDDPQSVGGDTDGKVLCFVSTVLWIIDWSQQNIQRL